MSEAGLGSATTRQAERDPWVVFSLLAVAQFMVVLDAGIVYVALPSIMSDLGFSQTGLAWVMDAYMLAFGGFMLLAGRAADLLGRRRVLIVGLVVFAVASLACGVAEEAWQLIAARVVQGLGAAMVSPVALALITDIFKEGPDRYKAFGLFGGVGGLAGASGVLFGGLLTAVAWQLAFLINVPIIIAVLIAGLRMVPNHRPTATGGVDVVGAVVGTGGLCLLLYGVLRGGVEGWASVTTLLTFVVAVLLLAAFVIRQLRAPAPLIPRMLFRLRNVVLGNLGNATVGALMFGVFYVVSLFLQQVRGFSPLQAALLTAPISLALFLSSQVTIRMFGRLSPVDALAGGLAIQAVALGWWAAAIGPESQVFVTFVLPGMLWGFGMGAAIVAAFVVCTSGLHGAVQGAASGLVSTTLQVGGAAGVVVLSAVAHDVTTGGSAASALEALATGQSYALWTAAAIAVIGLPFVLWLRTSWRPPAPHHAPADEPRVPAEAA
ncbi:EmrB/QacA subfamily drug resistance transporter [Micromonospora pisi]|uniref:EmrB/QacA subfamily drug resistance transporter n=1 Tax=Micromonospora pisi TaxID=589240 RepID=A0A495JP19_9ACTN|nr:MFS transporter [Micromonospora pisi]RKR90375.1 EmrB/QacA subfamily drug resistance transporter [Micromonospora pisi]